MITQNYNIHSHFPEILNKYCDSDNFLFFDIETTGLSPTSSFVYLISAGFYTNNTFNIVQYFAENMSEEINILEAFDKLSQNYKLLSHFNGDKFDIPYLKCRYEKHNIISHLSTMDSLDIYVELKKFKKFFNLPNCKLKTFEKLLKLNRNDHIDGGEAINEYYNYVSSGNINSLNECLLHNYEDVLNLPTISELLLFCHLYDLSNFDFNYYFDSNHFIIEAKLNTSLNIEIQYKTESIDFISSGNFALMKFRLKDNCIRRYYPNFRNYVFLKSENYAIDSGYAKSIGLNDCKKCNHDNAFSYIDIDALKAISKENIVQLWNENYSWIIAT